MNKKTNEVYKTANSRLRVNVGEESFALEFNTNADPKPEPRVLASIRNGEYGEALRAFEEACREHNVQFSYAWSGIINELGDHASARPPWKARARDWGRAAAGGES